MAFDEKYFDEMVSMKWLSMNWYGALSDDTPKRTDLVRRENLKKAQVFFYYLF
jgi:hypothetical protein